MNRTAFRTAAFVLLCVFFALLCSCGQGERGEGVFVTPEAVMPLDGVQLQNLTEGYTPYLLVVRVKNPSGYEIPFSGTTDIAFLPADGASVIRGGEAFYGYRVQETIPARGEAFVCVPFTAQQLEALGAIRYDTKSPQNDETDECALEISALLRDVPSGK